VSYETMLGPPFRWSFGSVTLDLTVGDLLEQRVGALVNSEQSNFKLDTSPSTLSGRFHRACPGIRQALLEQAQFRVLPPATVLETDGPDGLRVFHAGFHTPQAWVDVAEPDDVALHAANIQHCVDEILRRVRAGTLPGVAFPAIGTGLFRLPLETFARLFFDSVGAFAASPGRHVHVVLCLYKPDQLGPVLRHGTQALMGRLGGGSPLLREGGGHTLVRAMRTHVVANSDPFVEAGRLLWFAETALQVDLATALDASLAPFELLTRGQATASGVARMTFGIVRNRIDGLGTMRTVPAWLRERVRHLRSAPAREAIGRLVGDRNDLAHHRVLRDGAGIVEDVERLFGPEALPDIGSDEPTSHRWMHGNDEFAWLLDSVDLDRGLAGWRQPLSRNVETRKLERNDP
jgi:hypothetical protein